MKITLLGTGTSTGIPLIGCNCEVCSSMDVRDKRLRSSVFIETETTNILIDISPDFRQQALLNNITKIDAVLITHAHRDHIGGLDDLKPYNYLTGKSIPVYSEPNVVQTIRTEFHYAFDKTTDSVPQLSLFEINHPISFNIKHITITPIRLFHEDLPVLGYRIGKFAYLTDFSHIDNDEVQKLLDIDLLVIAALRHKPHPKHVTFSRALEIIRLINPRMARLTHMSHTLGKHADISLKCPSNVQPGFDNEMLTI